MEKEIRELTKQRDLAQSRVEDLLRMVGNNQDSRQVHVTASSLWSFVSVMDDIPSKSFFPFLFLKMLLFYFYFHRCFATYR